MKKRLIYSVVALIVISGSLAGASAFGSDEVTVKGEVIDQVCFENKNGARGEAHSSCAMACAKRGNQIAIIEDGSNTVYSISGDYSANKNEKLIPFVAEKVEAKGTVMEKDGKKWLNITSIKKME
ncbi:MAG: hypothetical protein L0229_14240 [Blastocatellia bacterium]|nr:hypothetical protein [Blastocatellia bacterium]